MLSLIFQPRLGPKPFTPPKLNETESFDKVFSVPPVPCNKTQNGMHEVKESNIEPEEVNNESVLQDETQLSLTDISATSIKCDSESNDKIDIGLDEVSSDSGYVKTPSTAERRKLFEPTVQVQEPQLVESVVDISAEEDASVEDYKPRTPSTAERRKIFEVRSNSKETEPEDNFDTTDQSVNFERASAQRTSIAERRKMYENRPGSGQDSTHTNPEKTGTSPVLLRRKGSFKSRKDEDVIEENRKTVPMLRQQSLDPQIGRKSESIAASTPKRTSTVFG